MRPLPLPAGIPRTKPRAMGIGLRYARGTLVTVYDAEDKPDPQQLKKAVWGFQRVNDRVACLQAKLSYYNPRQNLLTRWFTLEYDAWFNIFLPGLHRIGAPIPLGGTSNHFRRAPLEACLGWDPYNVTEDADLGLRFARLGLTTAMLESTTGEEANSRVGNWLRQRSRWSKGYMQTLLVHTRRPLRLLRQLGPRATCRLPAHHRRRHGHRAARPDLLADAGPLALPAADVDRRAVPGSDLLRGARSAWSPAISCWCS